MRIIVAIFFLMLTANTNAQDSLLTYVKVFNFDSVSKDRIYERALIWCGKAFSNSNYALRVSDKEAGIISSKASYTSIYYVPKKRDSVLGIVYSSFEFNMLIEVKENKLRVSVTELQHEFNGGKKAVLINDEPPVSILFQNKAKNQLEWDTAKAALIRNLDKLFSSLREDIEKRDNNW